MASDTTDAKAKSARAMKHQSTSLAGRPLHPSTLMMGYGYDPALSEGSLKPPIFLTSTYVFEKAADGKRFFEGIIGRRPGGAEGLVYGRFNGPDQEILEDRLALWEGAEDALVFSTGMSAITSAIMAYVKPGDVVELGIQGLGSLKRYPFMFAASWSTTAAQDADLFIAVGCVPLLAAVAGRFERRRYAAAGVNASA